MYTKAFVVFNVLAFLPHYSLACNGYLYKLLYFKECNENNVMKFKDPGTTLDKDCFIIPHGCMFTDGFKTAMVHYRAEKKPLPPIEGDYDLCRGLAENDEYAHLIASIFGLPKSCPVEKTEICSKDGDKISIAKYKTKLGLALGVSVVNLTIKHDNGETCLTTSSEFSKPRRG